MARVWVEAVAQGVISTLRSFRGKLFNNRVYEVRRGYGFPLIYRAATTETSRTREALIPITIVV